MRTLIELSDIYKSYPKIQQGRGRLSALKSALLNQPYQETHDIIKAISFSVRQGESLGIIGENGAGKSTLLKLISGVLRPTSGTIQRQGRIAALLELGAGFHPEHSGMDNIRMNAVLSGIGEAELADKLQAIIEFADIGEYLYEPVKHYSSGMVVRLGFAMMTALEPELLITDEVLAVGDESFQKKCIAWMQDYLSSGGTLMMCSHGMYHVNTLCQQAIWIEKGQIREYGKSTDVTQSYLSYHESKNKPTDTETVKEPSDGQYYIQSAELYNADGAIVKQLDYHSDLVVKGSVYSPDGREPVVSVGIAKLDDTPIFGTSTRMSHETLVRIDEKHFAFCLVFPQCRLLPGQYLIKAHALDPEAIRLFDMFEMKLKVTGEPVALGNVYLEHQWQK